MVIGAYLLGIPLGLMLVILVVFAVRRWRTSAVSSVDGPARLLEAAVRWLPAERPDRAAGTTAFAVFLPTAVNRVQVDASMRDDFEGGRASGAATLAPAQ